MAASPKVFQMARGPGTAPTGAMSMTRCGVNGTVGSKRSIDSASTVMRAGASAPSIEMNPCCLGRPNSSRPAATAIPESTNR